MCKISTLDYYFFTHCVKKNQLPYFFHIPSQNVSISYDKEYVPGIPYSYVMTEAASEEKESLHRAESVTVFRTKKGNMFWFGVGVSILIFSLLTAIGLIFQSWIFATIFAVIGIVSVSAIILAAHRTRYAFGQDELTISIPLALDAAVPPIPYSEVRKVIDSNNRRLFVYHVNSKLASRDQL